MLHDHHWSIEDANAVLPWIRSRVQRMRRARDRLVRDPQLTAVGGAAATTGGAWPGREAAEAALELVFGFEDLGRLEIVVRDLDAGLVDFPAIRDGDEIYLCWLLDEPSVMHWHAVEAGFLGRQPL